MVIVCAFGLYCVVTDFFGFAPTSEGFENTAVHIPTYATASAPAATADYVGSIGVRSARAVTKVGLPIIGTSPIAWSRTPTAVAATR
jgi:hypothetical protein